MASKGNDSAIVLGGFLLHLKTVNECKLLSEAQEAVAEIDRAVLHRAILTAKARGKRAIANAMGDVLKLLNAVQFLQGDEQFQLYKASLAPVLNSLEQKATEGL